MSETYRRRRNAVNQHEFERMAQDFVKNSPFNRVKLEKGGQEIRLFDEPLFGYASAEDPLFRTFQKTEVIGAHFLTPEDWLAQARTVISFFLPFTQDVRMSNREQRSVPGEGWLYGRVEGQQFIWTLCSALEEALRENGFEVVVPSCSERFHTVSEPDGRGLSFTSNWSERHAAFACGLGTFGLSRGLITAKGMAGRFGSLITDWAVPPTSRGYTQVYEYCIRCGRCAQRCPGQAISLEKGKSHSRCLDYQKTILHCMLPRFGCGLCQTDVPCEYRNPSADE